VSRIAGFVTLLTQRGQPVGDAEEEDEADDEAIGGPGPGDEVVEAGVVAGGGEGSAHGGGHEGVHGDQTDGEGAQAQHAAGSSAEVGGEEKEGELAGGFRAYSVQNADDEDGFAVVHPLKALGLRGLGIETSPDFPGEPEDAVDGDGEAALNAGVGVAVCVFAEDAGNDADAQNDEREADEALGNVVKVLRQAHVELEDGDAEGDDGESVAQGVGHPEAQATAPVALDGGDVRNGGKVVVVEAVAQAQEQAGA